MQGKPVREQCPFPERRQLPARAHGFVSIAQAGLQLLVAPSLGIFVHCKNCQPPLKWRFKTQGGPTNIKAQRQPISRKGYQGQPRMQQSTHTHRLVSSHNIRAVIVSGLLLPTDPGRIRITKTEYTHIPSALVFEDKICTQNETNSVIIALTPGKPTVCLVHYTHYKRLCSILARTLFFWAWLTV